MRYAIERGEQSLRTAKTRVETRCQYDPKTGTFAAETAAWGFIYLPVEANIGPGHNPQSAQEWADLLNLAEECQNIEKENAALEAAFNERADENRRKWTWKIIAAVRRDFPSVRVFGDLDPEVFEISPNIACFCFGWSRRCKAYADVSRHMPDFERYAVLSDRICDHFGLDPAEKGRVQLYKRRAGFANKWHTLPDWAV